PKRQRCHYQQPHGPARIEPNCGERFHPIARRRKRFPQTAGNDPDRDQCSTNGRFLEWELTKSRQWRAQRLWNRSVEWSDCGWMVQCLRSEFANSKSVCSATERRGVDLAEQDFSQ